MLLLFAVTIGMNGSAGLSSSSRMPAYVAAVISLQVIVPVAFVSSPSNEMARMPMFPGSI